MSDVVIVDEGATPQQALEHLLSVDTGLYAGRTDAEINPDLTGLYDRLTNTYTVERRYWKRQAQSIVEMSAAEKAAVDAAEDAALTAGARADAIQKRLGKGGDPISLRAIISILLDEINTLRTHAAIGLPARTLSQAKTAYDNAINSGAVDDD